jgi:hypothetical protein
MFKHFDDRVHFRNCSLSNCYILYVGLVALVVYVQCWMDITRIRIQPKKVCIYSIYTYMPTVHRVYLWHIPRILMYIRLFTWYESNKIMKGNEVLFRPFFGCDKVVDSNNSFIRDSVKAYSRMLSWNSETVMLSANTGNVLLWNYISYDLVWTMITVAFCS